MANLDVKEAVKLAKDYLVDLLGAEGINYVGLEEVELNENDWAITIGFCRPWNMPANSLAIIANPDKYRTYKIVHIDDTKKSVTAVKNRDV